MEVKVECKLMIQCNSLRTSKERNQNTHTSETHVEINQKGNQIYNIYYKYI